MNNLKSQVEVSESSKINLFAFNGYPTLRPLPIDLPESNPEEYLPAKQMQVSFYSKRLDKYVFFKCYREEDVFPVIPIGLVNRGDEVQDDDRDSTEADIRYGIQKFTKEIKAALREQNTIRKQIVRSHSQYHGGQRYSRNRSFI